MKKIITLMTRTLRDRLQSQMGIRLTIRDSVKKYIVDASFDPKFGARPLRRKIQTDIEDLLADEILSGNIKSGEAVSLGMKDGKICIYHD